MLAAPHPSNQLRHGTVFLAACEDKNFWEEQVRDKCLLLMTHRKSAAAVIDDGPAQGLGEPRRSSYIEPPGRRQRGQQAQLALTWPEDLSRKDESGQFTHNRRARQPSIAYNKVNALTSRRTVFALRAINISAQSASRRTLQRVARGLRRARAKARTMASAEGERVSWH